ncbi:hypothetical protein QBC47DRAFT_191001 [Echria macrotheca]|uniref:PPPDE domain-containing protein n=1 Tax=Echria macrotheca TaxID=438768 RepID=A0AAJ0F6D4_9PEZI|nr:hypothetical protein QBC47DRAFT_191001 [Echria macrotheca]
MDYERATRFEIGVLYESIHVGSSSSRWPLLGRSAVRGEDSIHTKHWALLFTTAGKKLRIELRPTPEGTIAIQQTRYDSQSIQSFPVGTFTGLRSDLDDMIAMHPMQGGEYSTRYNNCQHWLATALMFLEALSAGRSGRSFTVTHPARHSSLLGVLESRDYSKSSGILCHRVNMFLMTRAVLAQAAGIPVVAGGAALFLIVDAAEWKDRSTFRDPRIHGLPN